MNDSPTKRPRIPFGVFFAVFVPVFTLVFGWSAVSTTLEPKSYETEARIEVGLKSVGESQKRMMNYDVTKNETEFIGSESLLRKVIADLNLNDNWGKKYFNGETLKTWETLKILQGRINISSIPDTTLIQIRAYDDNPDDPAIMANAIAKAYMNYVATNSGDLQAQIVDTARANKIPVAPRVALNLTLGVLAGIFLGFIFGTSSAVFVYLKNRHIPTTPSQHFTE